ncbi:ABC transporter permease [Kaistia dalseonensis]|uniref:Rhamnose transport system permease protein n=1 Tax=Kaistia dalseonensis TaxID=410840 RepID=A0ABU0H682_9HYPH|nr:ABC transporter permease [Kaistia dalseonensis]MCX5495228.1 ABC transporter permease [Kaistia dalseonensis]MDQ0437814.1 rhamnose transport system permease protein [Kaistia dalseonensis]
MMAQFLKSRDVMLAGVILLLLVGIGIINPRFVQPGNLVEVFNDSSILIMVALAQMLVILTKCIDLSVSANIALTGMIVAMLNFYYPEIPVAALIAIAIIAGGMLGAINGLFIWKLGIPSIVVTLGTMSVYRGSVFLLSGGAWINAHQMSDAFKAVPRTVILGLPVLGWIGILTVLLIAVFLKMTRLGRSLYAAGGNPTAAVYAGIDVGRSRFYAYTIGGAIAGLAGYLWVSRYAVAYVEIAQGFELDTVAACVIGGISIAGGIGSVVGGVLGALFLGIVKNALPVIHISPFWQMAISGAVIIVAVVINARSERKVGRLILKEAQVHA